MHLLAGLLLASLLCLLYWKLCKSWHYWQERGVPGPPPSLLSPLGNAWPTYSTSFYRNLFHDFYGQPLVGLYAFTTPVLVVNDPELARQVLVKDFNHFVDRNREPTWGTGVSDAYWTHMMAFMVGDRWRRARAALSPAFTPGKMKLLMQLIYQVSDRLGQDLEQKLLLEDGFELRETFQKFSLDTLVSCAFGVDAQSFDDEDSPFMRHATNIFKATPADTIRETLLMIPGMTKAFRILGVNSVKPEETRFFANIIKKTVEQRRKTKERRNDLVDLMLDAMEGERLSSNDDKLDETTMIANALVLLVAGYETTGSGLCWIFYELANDQEVQLEVQREVDSVFEGSDSGRPGYSDIQSMGLLDRVIEETLRLRSDEVLARVVTTDTYTLPGTSVTMNKGDMVLVNVPGIHSDPKNFPQPGTFKPDNFSKQAKAERSQ